MTQSTEDHNTSNGFLSEAKIHKLVGFAAAMMRKAKAASDADSRAEKVARLSSRAEYGDMGDGDNWDKNDDANNETHVMKTAKAIMDKSGLSDLSEPESTESPSWRNPKKRKRTEEEKKTRKPNGFYYDGANRRNMAPKIVYPQDRRSSIRLTTRPWIQEAKAAQVDTTPTYITVDYLDKEGDDDIALMQKFGSLAPRVLPKDTMPVKDRKRFFMYTPTAAMKKAMRVDVSGIHRFFNPIKNIGDCMLHPHPPPLGPDGDMRGAIPYGYRWKDDVGNHNIKVNYGVVALLVNYHLTAVQKEGWIEEAWHLSHLCGNWTCCNWRHHTVEDGPTNISRNVCFGSTKECIHRPPCMKDKKRKLVLPAYKGKIAQATLPGMTNADVEEMVGNFSQSGCPKDCICCEKAKGKAEASSEEIGANIEEAEADEESAEADSQDEEDEEADDDDDDNDEEEAD